MKHITACLFLTIAMGVVLAAYGRAADAPSAAKTPGLEEARARARLLHEAMHATLHIVHREYYREDEGLKIPAATMKRVFHELAERKKVELRWIAVNADAMNTDHKPRNAFEEQAAKALDAGKDEFENVADGVYRYAGSIRLTSDCLKCHAPRRMSNKDRIAGLVISFPLDKP